jgi:hypothetical protein
MAVNRKDLTGALYKNDKRTTDKQPLYKGSCVIGGVEYWIASWLNDGDRGKYMSLKFEPKDKPEERPAKGKPSAQDDDGDIPF